MKFLTLNLLDGGKVTVNSDYIMAINTSIVGVTVILANGSWYEITDSYDELMERLSY